MDLATVFFLIAAIIAGIAAVMQKNLIAASLCFGWLAFVVGVLVK